MSEGKVIVTLSKKALRADINAGMKRDEIAVKYNISRGAITKALKQLGLNKTRAASVPFSVVDDEVEGYVAPTTPAAE